MWRVEPKEESGSRFSAKAHTRKMPSCQPAFFITFLALYRRISHFYSSLSLPLNLQAHKWHDNSKFSAWVNAFLFVCLSLLRLSCFFFFSLQLSEKNSKCSLNGWHVFRLRSWHAHPILMGFLCSCSAGPGRSLGIFGGKGLSLPGNGRNVACQMAEM